MNCNMAGLKVGIYIFILEIIKEKGCKQCCPKHFFDKNKKRK